jgi:NAD(P)H-dependent FMN reductase
LTQQLIARLIAEELPRESAEQAHVDAIYKHWPLPLYNVELDEIPVSLEQLKDEQDRLFRAEIGNSSWRE